MKAYAVYYMHVRSYKVSCYIASVQNEPIVFRKFASLLKRRIRKCIFSAVNCVTGNILSLLCAPQISTCIWTTRCNYENWLFKWHLICPDETGAFHISDSRKLRLRDGSDELPGSNVFRSFSRKSILIPRLRFCSNFEEKYLSDKWWWAAAITGKS